MGKEMKVCTMCTPWASDRVVYRPDWAGLRRFSTEGGFSRAGTRFESHLGYVFSLFRGLLVFFRVDSVHTLAPDLMFRVCGFPELTYSVVGERLTTADRVPPVGVPSGCSSLFVLPLGFRVHYFMVAMAAYDMIC